MPLILIVEDELELAEIVEAYLRGEVYQTERAGDGKGALELYRATRPDLVLLDVMMPKLNGLKVLKVIRQDGQAPVIILTARAEDEDKLLGLKLGSDDYIIKPFNPREVVARVKAVLRRSQQVATSDLLRIGPLEIHVDAHLKNLRKKLESVGAGNLIETVFGMGYKLVVHA